MLNIYPQDGINSAQDAQPTAYNIQQTSHITGLAECAVAIKSAAALRRLACETILNLRSSVVQHPRGDAIPNPFPHRHSICVISNTAFHLRFIDTFAVNVQIPRTQDTRQTLRRPPWSHSGLPSQNCETLRTRMFQFSFAIFHAKTQGSSSGDVAPSLLHHHA